MKTANRVTTTIGLPITQSKEDQAILRKLDKMKMKRGFRSRTTLIRILIGEEWDRMFPPKDAAFNPGVGQ
jgi:hypothetical protein